MKTRVSADEERLITRAVDVLVKELGPVEAGRFLSLSKKKRIESVKRHRKWQAKLKPEIFFDRVFGAQSRKPVKK